VVVEVLVAQAQAVPPLGQQVVNRILDPLGLPIAHEAAGEWAGDAGGRSA